MAWNDYATPGWGSQYGLAPTTGAGSNAGASWAQGAYGVKPPAAPAPIPKPSAPFNAGGPDRFEVAPSAPAGPSSEEQAMAWIQQMLGQAYPGGGGPNLSGYDTLLSDVAAREEALGGRKAEQEAYIAGIIEAARTRGTDAQGRIQGRYEEMGQTAADQRAGEINAIQNDELQRLAQRNAAREALGVAGGADIASAEAESAGAGITARGDSATRDAQIQQSIESQQYANQLAGLDPMQAQYGMALSNAYEDRLAQLASERAAYQQQRASAASSYRPSAPSIGELLALQDAAGAMFGPGETPELPGLGGITQQYSPYSSKAQQISNAASTFFASPEIQNQIKSGGKLDKATMVALISNSYPELFREDAYATSQLSDIVDYLTQ